MNVLGKNVIVYIFDSGVWRLYACATSCSKSVSTSTIETSTTGSGKWATFMPQKHGWTLTLEGVVNFDTTAAFYLNDLRRRQFEMTPLFVSYEMTDEAGHRYTEQGTAIIVNSSDTGPMDSVATFSIELQGTGALTQEFLNVGDQTRPFKVYTAFVTQSGTSAPTAVVLENTFGAVVWQYDGTGVYFLTLAGAFPVADTFITLPYELVLVADPDYTETIVDRLDDDTIRITNRTGPHSAMVETDGILSNFPVEIKVFI